MPELIDKYATMGAIPAPTDAFEAEYYGKICDAIEAMPTTEAEPVRHGQWQYDLPNAIFVCSECHMMYRDNPKYCPRCGARMDGGEQE